MKEVHGGVRSTSEKERETRETENETETETETETENENENENENEKGVGTESGKGKGKGKGNGAGRDLASLTGSPPQPSPARSEFEDFGELCRTPRRPSLTPTRVLANARANARRCRRQHR